MNATESVACLEKDMGVVAPVFPPRTDDETHLLIR